MIKDKCEICGCTEQKLLQIHHVNCNHDDNSESNQMVLCRKCHIKNHVKNLRPIARKLKSNLQLNIINNHLLYKCLATKIETPDTSKSVTKSEKQNISESKPYKIYNAERKRFVTIPESLADQLDIKPGSYVTWELQDNRLILRKAR